MKKIVILLLVFFPAIAFGQQFPFMEGYNVDPFILSPAYAGIHKADPLYGLSFRLDGFGRRSQDISAEL